ncbi:recombinase family protein [Peribacillus simplex]|uniref:recombinase family protein n=1 Tax=Peribacillus simplex TaxID=1478 RepID=UPI002989C69A|nr:recombinase family protein [Peribacillus simplex]MBX9955104.1 recombinase family protein [Peribacillus simplex]
MVENKGKAIGYVRISTVGQTDGVSIDAQKERVRLYCQLNDLELVDIVEEVAVSASKRLKERPQGKIMSQRLKDEGITHVVAYSLSRIFRSTIDALQQTEEWNRTNIAMHLTDFGGGALRTDTSSGRFLLSVLASVSQMEREQTAERTSSSLQHKKAKREAYCSAVYGWDKMGKNLKRNVAEQGVIGLMVKWHGEGASFNQIANRLNEMGVAAKRGGIWHRRSVRTIVLNEGVHEFEDLDREMEDPYAAQT